MTAPPPAASAPFRVLVVCTGNICRSPAAERLLSAGLARQRTTPGALGRDVIVQSAGTRARTGAPMTVETAALLTGHGVDPADFSARSLSDAMIRSADLVLAVSRAHRAAVVSREPSALSRTFTLRELARISAALPVVPSGAGTVGERLLALRDLANQHRRPPGRPDDDDVADPYGRDLRVYRRSFDRISEAVDTLVLSAGA